MSNQNDGIILSKNHRFCFDMQEDGNLVLYDLQEGHKPIWASGTMGKGQGPFKLTMQNDGNLVVYDSGNQPTWSTGTHGKGINNGVLVMQNDGNCVMYQGEGGKAIWCTRTDGGQKSQHDGTGELLI